MFNWFRCHVDLRHSDIHIHLCSRFGRVKHAFLITPHGTAHPIDVSSYDMIERLTVANDWMEAMSILRGTNA